MAGRGNLLDGILPPIVFVVVNALAGMRAAAWAALGLALIFGIIRLARRQPLGYALGGLGAVVVALAMVTVLDRAVGYFLPGMLSGGLTIVVCLVSALVRRPLVALTSYVARGWPLRWYWHPQVRPAYTEVSLAWAVFFGVRLLVQWLLFQSANSGVLGLANVLLGWPATIVLLVASYLYGTWRLGNLQGPSVEEFKAGVPSPWQGQQRGF